MFCVLNNQKNVYLKKFKIWNSKLNLLFEVDPVIMEDEQRLNNFK